MDQNKLWRRCLSPPKTRALFFQTETSGPALPKGKNNGQASTFIRLTQRKITILNFTVFVVGTDQQWIVEENFLRLHLRHAVLDFIFSAVTRIPLESDNQA